MKIVGTPAYLKNFAHFMNVSKRLIAKIFSSQENKVAATTLTEFESILKNITCDLSVPHLPRKAIGCWQILK